MKRVVALSFAGLLAAACGTSVGPLPCTSDLYCPVGQFCEANGFCGSAPTSSDGGADAGTDGGVDGGSDAGPTLTAPGAPTDVTALAGDGQATVSWTDPASNGGSALTGFVVTPFAGSTALAAVQVNNPAATSTTITGLSNGATYTFVVAAVNAIGTSVLSAASAAVTPATVPGAPSGVTAESENQQALVSWTPPDDNGGSELTGFIVTPYQGASAGTPVHISSGDATSTTVSGLTNGTAYTFTVAATNALGTGEPSAPSDPVTPATVPDAPVNVTATAANQQATVSWTAPADDGGHALTGFVVTPYIGAAAQSAVHVVSGTATSTTLNGLINGTAYTFTVAASNDVGVGDASAASSPVTPATVPSVPTGVGATGGVAKASVSWTLPADNGGSVLTGFVITPYTGATAGVVTTVSSGTATSAQVTGLINGTTYTFTVAAMNAAGIGAPSAASNSVTPATVPGTPTGISATAGVDQATVSWTGPTDNGGSAITGYQVIPYIGTAAGTAQLAGASATSTLVSGLSNGTTYTFTVSAINAVGTGTASAQSNSIVPVSGPGVPTSVSATAGAGQATIDWSTPTDDGGSALTGFLVTPYIGTSAGTGVHVSGGGATSTTITGLSNGTTYTFTVSAINAVGTGAPSAASNAVTPLSVPGAPTNVTASAGAAQVTVNWTAPTDTGGSALTGYIVTPYIATTAQTPVTLNNGGAINTVISGLTNGTAYTFTVAATNAQGTGATSAASNSATPLAPPGAPTGVSASAGAGQATVNWTAPSNTGGSGLTGFVVTPYIGANAQSATTVNNGTASSTTITGLTNGTAYTFTVAASNSAGTGPASGQSNSVTPLSVPGAPTGISATAGPAQATVSWTAPASNGGSALTGFVVTPYIGATAGSAVNVSGGAAVSTIITGLNNGTAYTFTVAAVNAQGTGPVFGASNSVTPADVPAAPTGVSAVAAANQATVSWTAPTNINGSALTGFVVTPYIGGTAQTATNVSGGSSISGIVSGLTNGTTYTFKVAATNGVGTGPASAASNAVTPLSVPGAPTGVTATAGAGMATVNWTAPVNTGGTTLTGFIITPYIGTTAQTPATVNNGSLTSGTVLSLTNGTAYTFTVSATNSVGTGPASTASSAVTPEALAGAPTAVSATGGAGQATVHWTAPTNNGGSALTGFVVTPYIGATAQTVTNVSGGSAINTTVSGLTNGTAYTFTVAAVNGLGTGPASTASNSVTPLSVPGVPTGVTATAGNAQASVSWSAPGNTGGASLTGFVVTPYIGGTAQSTTTISNGSATGTTITGLTNGTAYTFTVAATNSVGTGAASTASSPVTPATLATAPTNVTATAGAGQATVSWTDPSSNGGTTILSYTVTAYNGGAIAGGATVNGATATSTTVTTLTNGTAYTFTVSAVNAIGTGPASSMSNSVTPLSVPNAPTNVTATAGAFQATVNWTLPSNNGGTALTGFVVTPYISGTAQTTSSVSGGTATSTTVTNLTGGSTYTFTVSAVNSVGTGPASTASAAVTLPNLPGAPTNVTATAFNARVQVSWTKPTNQGGGLTGWLITAYSGGAQVGTLTNGNGNTIGLSYNGLTNGTTYTFTVTAQSAAGYGPASAMTSPATPVDTIPSISYFPVAQVCPHSQACNIAPPNNTGGTVITYSISPPLPTGLTMTATGSSAGTITGVATTLTDPSLTANPPSYTISATNSGGTATGFMTLLVTPSNAVTDIPYGLALGYNHSCAIVGGGVQCWGEDTNGQIGDNNSNSFGEGDVPIPTPTQVVGVTGGVTAVATGNSYTCAIVNGGVECWGANDNGQLGNDTTVAESNIAVPVYQLSGVQQLTTGYSHACALENGIVECWGDNGSGELGTGSNTLLNSAVPLPVNGLPTGVQMISASEDGSHTCALANGAVYCWGNNLDGELGNNSTVSSSTPVQVSGLTSGVTSIAVGQLHSCANTKSAMECWGYNHYGELGYNTNGADSLIPKPVVGLPSAGPEQISGGDYHTCAIFNGTVYCWGANFYGQLGYNATTVTSSITPLAVPGTAGTSLVASGGDHTCAVINGALQCWGWNMVGQLGNNLITDSNSSSTPVQVLGLNTSRGEMVTGGTHVCQLVNGGVQCWGDNDFGQLGNGSNSGQSNVPGAVMTLSGVQQVAAGYIHSCARVNGAVECWGRNANGELGNNSSTDSDIPVPVSALSSAVTQVGAGGNFSCAVQKTGVQCWGTGIVGQLGNDAMGPVQSLMPVTVNGLGQGSGVQSIAVGADHVCALLNGTVQCWGGNEDGQLGNGTNTASDIPITVAGLSGVTQIAAGNNTTCALTAAGEKCWGNNGTGQVGNNSLQNSLVPVPVQGASTTGISNVSVGFYYSCGLSNGSALCWGSNSLVAEVNPAGPLDVQQVSQMGAGDNLCMIVNGGFQCLGDNRAGEIGNNGSTTGDENLSWATAPWQ